MPDELQLLGRELVELTTYPGSAVAKVKLNRENSTIDLYWKGPLPSHIADFVSGAEPIRVMSAEYSRAEMRAIMRDLAALPVSARGGSFVSSRPNEDYSAIELSVTSARRLTSHDIAELEQTLSRRVGPEVNLHLVEDYPMQALWRWEDTEPFSAGAMMANTTVGNFWTSAFAAYAAGGPQPPQATSLLTARQCGTGNHLLEPAQNPTDMAE